MLLFYLGLNINININTNTNININININTNTNPNININTNTRITTRYRRWFCDCRVPSAACVFDPFPTGNGTDVCFSPSAVSRLLIADFWKLVAGSL